MLEHVEADRPLRKLNVLEVAAIVPPGRPYRLAGAEPVVAILLGCGV